MRKCSTHTFYFFPAFLPLVQLVPWLLTLIGVVAGVAGFSGSKFWKKHRKIVIGLSILCFGVAVSIIIMAMPSKEVRYSGTRELSKKEFATTSFYQPINQGEVQSGPFNEFGIIWSSYTDKRILSTPIIKGSLLIYGSYEGSIEAISLDNGKAVWRIAQRAPILTLSQDKNGVIYSGEGTHNTQAALLTAVDALNGRTIWSRELLGHIEETASFDEENNRMWTGSGPGGLWAIDNRDGKVLWHQAIGHIDSKPLFIDDKLYVEADIDEKNHQTALFALDADDGEIIWQISQRGQPWGSPLIDKTGEKILTTTGVGQIGITKPTDAGWAYAVSTEGKVLWDVELSGMPLQPGIYLPEGDLVIHTLKNGQIAALHAGDGSIAWSVDVGDEFQSPATLITSFAEPLLASTSFNGIFTIRNARTGNELFRQTVGNYVISSPVISGDILYVTSANEVTAFGGVHKLLEKE